MQEPYCFHLMLELAVFSPFYMLKKQEKPTHCCSTAVCIVAAVTHLFMLLAKQNKSVVLYSCWIWALPTPHYSKNRAAWIMLSHN